MLGTFVRRYSSTFTWPRSSSFTPTSSRPSPFEFGLKPTATSTLSASKVFSSPPSSTTTTVATPSLTLQLLAFALSKTSAGLSSFFLSLFSTTLTTSLSVPGRSWSIISTTVIFVPSFW